MDEAQRLGCSNDVRVVGLIAPILTARACRTSPDPKMRVIHRCRDEGDGSYCGVAKHWDCRNSQLAAARKNWTVPSIFPHRWGGAHRCGKEHYTRASLRIVKRGLGDFLNASIEYWPT